MRKIEVDEEVYEALEKRVKSFNETPNDVLRRLLDLSPRRNLPKPPPPPPPDRPKPSKPPKPPKPLGPSQPGEGGSTQERIQTLRDKSLFCHSSFLTFLIDKYADARGNFADSVTLSFMERFNLMPSMQYRNPWMKASYKKSSSALAQSDTSGKPENGAVGMATTQSCTVLILPANIIPKQAD